MTEPLRIIILLDCERSGNVVHVGRVLTDLATPDAIEVAVLYYRDAFPERAAALPVFPLDLSEGERVEITADFSTAEHDPWTLVAFEQLASERREQLGIDAHETPADRDVRDLRADPGGAIIPRIPSPFSQEN